MRRIKLSVILVFALGVSSLITACATPKSTTANLPPEIATAPPANPEPAAPSAHPSPLPTPSLPDTRPTPDPSSGPSSGPSPSPTSGPSPSPTSGPTPSPSPLPLPAPQTPVNRAFTGLPFWQSSDPTPALIAFQKSCRSWQKRPDTQSLFKSDARFGHYSDWRETCRMALQTRLQPTAARAFFAGWFLPVPLTDNPAARGLLTGYYAPEIPVRHLASLEFSEPILARPKSKAKQNLPRKDISVTTSRVLAYGRPVDVFFLHVQGSGTIRFEDGSLYMAAFDGHNNKPYTSIGRVLIKRGELDRHKASKADLEAWMQKAGYRKTKALLNENARYVFFKTEYLTPGEGPKGAQGIPLTPMGSLAIDKKLYPYGLPIWVESQFPQQAHDYTGQKTAHLLITQDTGGAIKGELRGDVFFGNGQAAGEKAGVMNHKARWTVLLPTALALKLTGLS